MTQVDGSGTAPNGGVTNGREIGAYAIAQVIKLFLIYGVSFSGLLSPLYLLAFHAGGQPAVFALGAVISVIWAAVALLIFLLLRGAFGGIPATIAAASRGQGGVLVATGCEIGAYAIAYGIVIGGVLVMNTIVISGLYAELGRSGQRSIVFAIGLAISLISIIVAYLIFIGLREGFYRR